MVLCLSLMPSLIWNLLPIFVIFPFVRTLKFHNHGMFRGRLVTLSKTQCSVFKHWTLVSKILKNAFGQPTVFWVVWKWLLQKPYLNSVFWNQLGADFKTTKLFSSGTLVIKVRFERAHLVSFFGRLSPLFTLVSSHAPKITQLQRSHQLQWTRNSPPTSITPFT